MDALGKSVKLCTNYSHNDVQSQVQNLGPSDLSRLGNTSTSPVNTREKYTNY